MHDSTSRLQTPDGGETGGFGRERARPVRKSESVSLQLKVKLGRRERGARVWGAGRHKTSRANLVDCPFVQGTVVRARGTADGGAI